MKGILTKYSYEVVMNREKVLEKMITKYATSYYRGETEISDEAFDSLVDELRSINPNNELLRTPGWGYDPGKQKVNHWYNLTIGSLNKIKDGIDVVPERFTRSYTRVSAKLDGISVVSYYVHGKLVQAVTRGDGNEGLDVTSKIVKMLGADSTFRDNFTGAVRGEVVMPTAIFNDHYNTSLNPRNIAAGIMNRDDDTDLNRLRYVVYKVLASDSHKFKSIVDVDLFLSSHFMYHAPYLYYADTGSNFESMYLRYKKDYPCDGLVFSNMVPVQDEDVVLNWDEIAYKFEAESKEVVVKEVKWEASRTGRIVPVIWFNPVGLSGAIVQKCTGFNAQFIKDNSIGVGSKIKVLRSGEVIPTIQSVIEATEADLPTTCPNCGSPLRWSGVDLVCDYENESQLAYHFISTLAPVDGAGYSLYNSIVDGFELTGIYELGTFLDTLRLNEVDTAVESLVGRNFISGEVTKSKATQVLSLLINPVDPVQFLVACSIPGISAATASAIFNKIPDFIDKLRTGDPLYDDLLSIPGIGDTVVHKLIKYQDRVLYLSNKMQFKEVEIPKESQFKVAITGALSVKRADFDNKLKERGIVQSGNWNEIKYLITNNPDSGSSKMKIAKEKGIEIISEEEFTKMYLM